MQKLSSLLTSAPGFFGEILNAIDNLFPFPSPHISIPATLSFLATLKAGRVKVTNTPFDTHSSLYTCSIARSGSGKTLSQHALSEIIKRAEIPSFFQGIPVSDAAVFESLINNPRQLILWDEFGSYFNAISQSKQSYEARIFLTLMTVYSATGSTIKGKAYATQEPIDIKEPYLNIFAASTASRFFRALNEDFINDGLLPRWLVFFEEKVTKKRRAQRGLVLEQEIIDYLKTLETWASKKEAGNLEKALGKDKDCLPLRFADGCINQHNATKLHFNKLEDSAQNDITAVFWARAYENYCKVLIAVSEEDVAFPEHIFWASDLIESCIKEMLTKLETCLAPPRQEDKAQKMFEYIKPGEWIEKSTLTKRGYNLKLNAYQCNQIYQTFLEAGLWKSEERYKNGSERPTTYFSRTIENQ